VRRRDMYVYVCDALVEARVRVHNVRAWIGETPHSTNYHPI